MGFWADIKRAYREGAAKQTPKPAEPPAGEGPERKPADLRTFDSDGSRLPAVGEASYQHALRVACDNCQNVPLRVECRAAFIAEPENPYDPYAIRVEVSGRKVGYFSRDDAREHRPVMSLLQALGYSGGECAAMIAGREGIREALGIWLHLPHPDLLLEELEEERV